jgi:hypothetical protein
MLTKIPDLRDTDVVEPLITLARCSIRDRIIVLGERSPEVMFELHRRGYLRVVSSVSAAAAVLEFDVALVDWRTRSIKTLGPTLNWLLKLLDQYGVVVIWVDSQDPAGGKVQSVLRKCGLTIEAGTVRDHGSVISACCRESRLRPRPL